MIGTLDHFSGLWGGTEALSRVVWYLALVWLGKVDSYRQCERRWLGCGLWMLLVCIRKACSSRQ